MRAAVLSWVFHPSGDNGLILSFVAQVATLPSLILALSPSGVTSSIRSALRSIRVSTSPQIPSHSRFGVFSFFHLIFVFVSVVVPVAPSLFDFVSNHEP
ncbi:hypothetical protein DEO72_LG11g1648 [Vigna unguiculata]|uniref:Uncharacterized protein n=1 Tax=Vigna unguiculata TaxID=3917 RepID=A0A4D6NQT6_VIGUN|nr:hypothetical protein DEO72_LG11g1648 [Vigna unguiculata]